MPRSTTMGFRGLHLLPRVKKYFIAITVAGTDITRAGILKSEFTRSVCPEIGSFKIKLINTDGRWSVFKEDDEVILKFDLVDGSTQRFKGLIQNIINKQQASGPELEITGGHVSNELLDITVTESYTGDKSADDILKEIVDNYLTGYTYANVNVSSVSPTINWSNKPFWDCVHDLVKLTEYDAYVDDDKDFHFFVRKSIENNNEAIVWNDTLIKVEGLGTRGITQKNKILVYGEDKTGLPVISTVGTGTKEKVVRDSNVKTVSQADETGDAEFSLESTPELEGKADSWALPSLSPGDKIWISYPPMKITDQYRVINYTHKYPMFQTKVVIQRKRDLPDIFKEREEKELALETITNPHKMSNSWNFVFDDLTELKSFDSNIGVTDSKLVLSSGTEGIATSVQKGTSFDITEVHLRVVGENFGDTEFNLSTQGGADGTYQGLTPESLNSISTPGNELVLQIKIKNALTKIDGLVVMYK